MHLQNKKCFADEINGVAVRPIGAIHALHIRGNVTAESHDVLNACGLHVGNTGANRLTGGGDAGEVGEGGHAVGFLDGLGDVQGVLAGASSRAVGHADEGGMEVGDLLGSGLHGGEGGVGLGGEDLKGEGEAVAGQQLGNLHGDTSGDFAS